MSEAAKKKFAEEITQLEYEDAVNHNFSTPMETIVTRVALQAFEAGEANVSSSYKYNRHQCPDCPAFGKYCPHPVDKSKYDLPREENLYLLDLETGVYSCQLTVDKLMEKMK